MSPINNPSKPINSKTAEKTQQYGHGSCSKNLKALMQAFTETEESYAQSIGSA